MLPAANVFSVALGSQSNHAHRVAIFELCQSYWQSFVPTIFAADVTGSNAVSESRGAGGAVSPDGSPSSPHPPQNSSSMAARANACFTIVSFAAGQQQFQVPSA